MSLEEIAKYGNPTIKRIYGDWTKPYLSKWKGILLEHAITPIQQYGYTTGKNATDSAMIIEAMDILYSDKVDGFCLVSFGCEIRIELECLHRPYYSRNEPGKTWRSFALLTISG